MSTGGTARGRLRRDGQPPAMVAPAFLVLPVFGYLPILGNVIAFQDYDPYAGGPLEEFLRSEWIGFGRFQLLLEDPAFWHALRNTLTITAFQLVFFFPLPILLAVMPPTEAIKMAVVVLTVAPIAVGYPLVQRHFIKGVLIGAVKG